MTASVTCTAWNRIETFSAKKIFLQQMDKCVWPAGSTGGYPLPSGGPGGSGVRPHHILLNSKFLLPSKNLFLNLHISFFILLILDLVVRKNPRDYRLGIFYLLVMNFRKKIIIFTKSLIKDCQ